MTDDEGLSVREAVEWCGNGLTLREITRLRRLDGVSRTALENHASDARGWPGRARRDVANDPDGAIGRAAIGCCVV
jgi:hypothetical protein